MTKHQDNGGNAAQRQGEGSEEEALQGAVQALNAATEAVRAARREVTAAIVAAYRAGLPLPRIAQLNGTDPVDIRNRLEAVGEPRRRR
jgi:hypothetical protein